VAAGDRKIAGCGRNTRNTILCEWKTIPADTKDIVYSRALPPISHWRRHHLAGGGKARSTPRACACSFAQMTVAAAAFPVETDVVICTERPPDSRRRVKRNIFRTGDFRSPHYYTRLYVLFIGVYAINGFYSIILSPYPHLDRGMSNVW
jgi:hypothetical protein